MTDIAEKMTEEAAAGLLLDALAAVSLQHGVLKTCEILDRTVDKFKNERRVAGAHGYGYRR